MTTRNKSHGAADPRKVDDLKMKAREEANRSKPTAGKTAESILYGPQNDNQRAAGGGEFDS